MKKMILVREKPYENYTERIFVRFENNGVVCKNIWRPEKDVFWEDFKKIDNIDYLEKDLDGKEKEEWNTW